MSKATTIKKPKNPPRPKRIPIAPTGPKGKLKESILPTVQAVHQRLSAIFPVGVQFRSNIVSQPGARTVFVALYTGSVTTSHRWIGPKHIAWMGDTQAEDLSAEAREAYGSKPVALPGSWYKENSRELRDTVITKGLLPCAAMDERPGLAVNSSVGRYALMPDFAELFDVDLVGERFEEKAAEWRGAHLSKTALMRIDIARKTLTAATAKVAINFPSGDGIVLPEGPSPAILKAVVEEFGPRFLGDAQVLWISDGRKKHAYMNEHLETSLGMSIDSMKTLPDLIMVDMNPPGRPGRALVVFVQAVASDGQVDELRQRDLTGMFTASGLDPGDCAFVTAYLDKTASGYGGTSHGIAWRSFVWFVSEPDCLIHMRGSGIKDKIASLML